MLEVLARCFAERYQSGDWQTRLRSLMPSLGRSLHADAELCSTLRARALAQLCCA
jgi:malate dehydrogenase (quinone)